MGKDQKINKAPFDYLDAYQEESFRWAEKVLNKIRHRISSDGLDIEMLSIAFASIFNDFIHISMKYYAVDFESYLTEFYEKEESRKKFELMHDYRKRIYEAMMSEYGESYKIYESLKESVLIKDEEEEGVYHNPVSNSRELASISFVDGHFNY